MDDNEFALSEVTQVASEEIQKELLAITEQDLSTSEFWFRFQAMEKENLLLRNAFKLIHDCMKDQVIITQELREIIFRIAASVVENNIAVFE